MKYHVTDYHRIVAIEFSLQKMSIVRHKVYECQRGVYGLIDVYMTGKLKHNQHLRIIIT